jgi:alkanesulfonate monooxygenase SsuD/methylene tetrahydromethanopterin reductase-like flavin-dependent oxidoreductase (luciferase family)
VPAGDIAEGRARLAELAGTLGRPTPTIAVGATGALGDGVPTRAEIAEGIRGAYGMSAERAAAIPITGGPHEVAERLAAYREAGARHLVIGFSGGDWRRQCELLVEARDLSR